jgi:hypothetical protein
MSGNQALHLVFGLIVLVSGLAFFVPFLIADVIGPVAGVA